MIRLTLLRHAKSDWSDRGTRDIERPLNPKGQRAARAIGEWVARQSLSFDLALASPAARVAETIAEVERGAGASFGAQIDARIYLAGADTLADVVRERGGVAGHLLLVGHNPGLEELVSDLVDAEASAAILASIEEKYPTGALAIMAFPIDCWADLRRGTGVLEAFTRPRDLDPELGPGRE